MNGTRLYWRYISISLRSQMQYPASFILMSAAYCIQTAAEFFSLWVLLDRFHEVGGWHLAEVALLYGMINISLALAECSSRGFDQFYLLLKSGGFDILLLRPRNTILQIAGLELHLMRVGRLIQGGVVLVWAIRSLPATWGLDPLALTLFAILGGACFFCGLLLSQATLAFWTTETLELMNILTFGGTEAGRYPMSIYNGWFRTFFTFIIPLACVNYFPALTILQREGASPWVGWVSPFVCLTFLGVTIAFWNVGVRHYRSTGS